MNISLDGFVAVRRGAGLMPVMEDEQGWVDWVYMISMAVIGVAQLVGLAAIGGAIWMVLFLHPPLRSGPRTTPSLDDHVVEFIILLGLAYVPRGATSARAVVGAEGEIQRYPVLR